MLKQKLKVIVLSGFLGAGKTTLVKRILGRPDCQRISIILNDVSQIDIDKDLVKNDRLIINKSKDIIQMKGGCVCCTLKQDMIKLVKKIAKSKKFDYLVIQATGVSTPLPVAQAFVYTEGIPKYAEVINMVTVVDAFYFWQNIKSSALVQEKNLSKAKNKNQSEQMASLADLMIGQLQIANTVLVNKIDLVDQKTLQSVIQTIKGLNPQSCIQLTIKSAIPLQKIFTKMFDLQKSEIQSHWISEREKVQDVPQTVKFRISSFVYRRRRPFEPHKLWDLLQSQKYWPFWNKITRAKGFFWLACHPRYQFVLHKAGAKIYYNLQKPWYCQMPKSNWVDKDQLSAFSRFIQKYFEKPYGDKRIQLVFICQDLEQKVIENGLDNCLVPAEEMQIYQKKYARSGSNFDNMFSEQRKGMESLLLMRDQQWQQVDDQADEQGDDE